MEKMTYAKVNFKKNPRHSPEARSTEKDAETVVYADIRTAAPEVQEKVLTRSHYRNLKILIGFLISIIIGLISGFLVWKQQNVKVSCQGYHHNTKEKKCNETIQNNTGNNQLYLELCVKKADGSSGCLLCPNGWILHGDGCYYYSDVTGRTWNQSRDHCEMMGADLLVIKNWKQQEFIQRNIRQRGEDKYWIGLHRDGDGWRWVDGEHYNSGLIQLEIYSSGRCVSMTKSGYYQEDCSSTNRWICLKKAVRISP